MTKDTVIAARMRRQALDQPLQSKRELNEIQQRVLDVVQEIGPADTDQMKEELDGDPLLKKQIMPALHRMQEAFLVFEEQTETTWEHGWSDFESEWPEIDLERRLWEEAASEVLSRFFDAMVFATLDQVRDWSGWSAAKVRKLLASMEANGKIQAATVEGVGEGGIAELPDVDLNVARKTLMIHRSDFLATAYAFEHKERYGDLEVLQYLLIDG
tara:strand:+ start:407 stop:1048 length:642 start_codon:yes stop_codon:yes gene_type:complete